MKVTIDGTTVEVAEGSTILDACRRAGIGTPTLCYGDTLTPVNVCRVCVVELEGARTLVPSCSRKAEDGMVVRTDTDRVRTSIPSSALREHEGTSVRAPSSSTTQTRQTFTGVSVSP